MGAEITEVEEELKCPEHLGGLIETSPGTTPRGREGGKANQGGGLPLGIFIGESIPLMPLNGT